ncbi:hypothetical protein [Haloplanus salilacus]|uniref:hypothetical protein n=1 Tax=Haloplanus salilacus TaxID=2949994 RepID=UPI0030CDB53C
MNGEAAETIGITRNLTERVKQQRRLRSQKEQLDEFASAVSHDLRNMDVPRSLIPSRIR